MFHRTSFRILSAGLTAALLVSAAVFSSSAQQPPQPPTPKPTPQTKPQQKDDKQKKAPNRQGAQADERPTADDAGRIVLDTDLVLLDVTVVDQNNTPLMTLSKDDFTVYEDKIKQTVDAVTREEVPLSFGMVIDTSGSMRSKLQTVTDAALSLIKQMRPDDEAFLAPFKAEPELVQDFTADKRELEEALGALFTSGGTALLDAIIATADYAHEKGKQRRKALIVITDGVEKNSGVKEKEVLEAIKEDEVQLYLVGFVDEDESGGGLFNKSPAKRARELLARLAEDSGGRAFFPKDVSEMPAVAAQIAKDMRTQYVLSYYPSNDKRDGTFRNVQVVVAQKDNRKLLARTRRGYYAKNAAGQTPTAAEKKLRGTP